LILLLFGCAKYDAASIAVIGAPDGPTALMIFRVFFRKYLFFIIVTLIAAVIGFVIYKNKKKK
jgi:Na+-transporting methylmalonyl-CoA/oxaloacetate decarboxylase beta subunit